MFANSTSCLCFRRSYTADKFSKVSMHKLFTYKSNVTLNDFILDFTSNLSSLIKPYLKRVPPNQARFVTGNLHVSFLATISRSLTPPPTLS